MKFSIKAAALVTTFFAAFSSNADVISTYDIDFATADLEAHQQNSNSTYDVYTNGVLNLRENAWITLNLFDTFGISELDLDNGATSYNFTFDIRVLPGARNPNPNPFTEIAGVWFADFTNGEQNHDASRTFNLAGTQNFGIQDLEYTNAPRWETFSINLDDYFSGVITDIVFINDCDLNAGCGDMKTRFRNASITEVSEPGAMSLILLGMGLMGWRARRQK